MYDMQQPWNNSLQTPEAKQCGLLLHLSQLAGFIVPFGGIIAPIVVWQTQKEKYPAIDQHGKMIVNWILSAVIYALISFVLTFVIVGILGFLALGIASIAFPIIGAVKANNGELWEYPLTIKFLK